MSRNDDFWERPLRWSQMSLIGRILLIGGGIFFLLAAAAVVSMMPR